MPRLHARPNSLGKACFFKIKMIIEQVQSYISLRLRYSNAEDILRERSLDLAVSEKSLQDTFAHLVLTRAECYDDFNPVIVGEMAFNQNIEFWAELTPQKLLIKSTPANTIIPFRRSSNRDGDFIDQLSYGSTQQIKEKRINIRFNRHHRDRERRYWQELVKEGKI
jgi:hypothetical protein